MIADAAPGRRITAMLAGFFAVAGATFVLAVPGAHDSAADTGQRHGAMSPAKITKKQAAFHDAMRKLWEDHITWTRLAIVSFAHDLPDLPATEARLLDNQTDIGNAIEPYYGRAAGNRLTALLEEHITGAVALLAAAKAGDPSLIQRRSDEWYANGDEIADFLSDANPRNWPQRDDAPHDEGPPRPDPQRGDPSARRRLRRRHPRLRGDPSPHPRDGRRPQRRDHQAVPTPVPVSHSGHVSEPSPARSRSPGSAGADLYRSWGQMAAPSYLRASDAERDAIAERLRRAAAEGRLEPEELEERLHAALRARTHGDLERLVVDLPRQPVPSQRRRVPTPVYLGGVAAVALRVVVTLAVIAAVLTVAAVMTAWWILWAVVWFVLRGHGCARRRGNQRHRLAGQR